MSAEGPVYCRCTLPHAVKETENAREAKDRAFKEQFEQFFAAENPGSGPITWLEMPNDEY